MGPAGETVTQDRHCDTFTPHFIEDILRPQDTRLPRAPRETSRHKKMRTTFTGRQIFIMEKMFESKKYLNATERSHLSRELCVTEQQVKIWFQNRRTKWKKQENLGIGLTKKIEDVGVEDKGILDDNNDRIKSDNLKLENDTTNTKLLKPSESLKCSSLEISRM